MSDRSHARPGLPNIRRTKRRLACAIVIGLGAPGAAAQTAADRELGSYELAYPSPSSDERAIVFQGNFDGHWQLYRMETATGAITRLATSTRDDTQPALSPDGKQVAFVSNRDGNDDIHVLDLASGVAKAVAPHPGKDGHPHWSADGKWLVFNRTLDPADRDGDRDAAILRVHPDGQGLEVLSDSPRIETFPVLSPDGRSVAFVEWFPGAPGKGPNGEIVTVDLASGKRRNLTNSPGFDGYPAWGTSGWLYFSATLANGQGAEEMVVHRIRADGSGLQRLGTLDGHDDVRAVPNGAETMLYYNIDRDGRVQIRAMPLPAAPA